MDNKSKKNKEQKGKHNPEKYIELNPVDEAAQNSANRIVVLTFGRFNPVTIGHEKLVGKLLSVASKEGGTPEIYASHTQDAKKNPLSYDLKLSYLKQAFGNIVMKSNAKTILQVAKELENKYSEMIVVVGKDRVSEFETLLNKYNGIEYKFDKISVVSAGDRDPDSDNASGMSASKMRSFAMLGNSEQFKTGLPKKLSSKAQEIYNDIRKGMGIMEDILPEDLEEGQKALTIQQRRKRGMTMRRYRTKIKMAREKAKRRMASPEKLKLRAQRKARGIIRDRLMKNKSYSEMSPAEKVALDTRLARMPKAALDRIARKQLPIVRKAEIQRLSDMHKAKTEQVDLNSLFEQFINEPKEARKKKFRYLYTKEGKVNYDKRFKMFKPKGLAENLEEDLYSLIESVEEIYEGKAVERVRANIEMEKVADKRKHDRMLDRAREIDKVRFEGVDKKDPKNREYGTDSLLKILKADTPGEDADIEIWEYNDTSTETGKKK